MVDPSPFFSLIIPTYNRAHLIGATIESALKQDFCDFELLVVDDGSQDNTEEIVKGFSDHRIKYFKKENAERGAARNYGASRSHGRYLNFFDSDDRMYPFHLSKAYAFLQLHRLPGFFHMAYDYKTREGDLLQTVNNFDDSIKEKILFDNVLSCNGVFIEREIALQFPFHENRSLASSEDWELWIRLACRFPLFYSNEVTSTIVGHDHRSIFTIKPEKIIARDLLLISNLQADTEVMKHYQKKFKKFIADRYTFFMLSLAADGKRAIVWMWAWRTFAIYPLILTNKRFIASLKKTIL